MAYIATLVAVTSPIITEELKTRMKVLTGFMLVAFYGHEVSQIAQQTLGREALLLANFKV